MAVIAGLFALGGAAAHAYTQKKAGDNAEEVGRQNAAMLRETAAANVALGMEAASYNAGSVLRVGGANAAAIETVYQQNAELMAFEGEELIRRHFREEQHMLGTIRAMQGGGGAQVNTGTPLAYFLDQATEGETSRRYQGEKIKRSILNYMTEQQLRADMTRLDASERAGAIMFNADIESQVALNEANMNALAMESGAASLGAAGRLNAGATLLSGAANAFALYKGI